MKRRQTLSQRRKLDRIAKAEEAVAAKRKAYETASSHAKPVRWVELRNAMTRALKLERASS